MKIRKSSYISPFGGLNFVIDELDKHRIGDVIEAALPSLAKQSKYSWRDIIYSYWSVYFCGGDCAEDLSDNFGKSLKTLPNLCIPSPDRILNRLKELAQPTSVFKSPRSKANHEFAINERLNRLNLAISKRLNKETLSEGILDYDNTICHTKKKDATRTYKFEDGYQPGVAFIGSQVVYLENRTGNSPAHTGQDRTLSRMFTLLKEYGINVKRFRADSATYGLDMLQVIDEHAEKYYIRARMNQTLERAIANISNWEPLAGFQEEKYRGETTFTPFQRRVRDQKDQELKTYRLIVTKTKRKDGQINYFTGEAYLYSAILTNDRELSANQVVHFYNQRGAAEREFEILKHDFGWGKLPFSFLEENNVYLLIMAMCRNIYQYLIGHFSKTIKGLKPNYRVKKFIFRFICIPAKWVKHARQWHLQLYGDIAFKT